MLSTIWPRQCSISSPTLTCLCSLLTSPPSHSKSSKNHHLSFFYDPPPTFSHYMLLLGPTTMARGAICIFKMGGRIRKNVAPCSLLLQNNLNQASPAANNNHFGAPLRPPRSILQPIAANNVYLPGIMQLNAAKSLHLAGPLSKHYPSYSLLLQTTFLLQPTVADLIHFAAQCYKPYPSCSSLLQAIYIMQPTIAYNIHPAAHCCNNI
jgi:hypothetical protein